MKINQAQLQTQLKTKQHTIVLLSGDEPFLIDEASRQTICIAKKLGYIERDIFHIDNKTSTADVTITLDNLDLFGSRKVVELRFKDKPTKPWQTLLVDAAEKSSDDTLLLLRLPKIDAGTQKTQWFKRIEQQSLFLPLWPIKPEAFPNWLKQQAAQLNCSIDAKGLALIAQQTEGNLLAAHQCIEALALYNTPTHEQIEAQLSQHARFDVFALIDAILQCDKQRMGFILKTLKLEGVEPTLIFWAINHELHTLLGIIAAKSRGENLNAYYKTQRIWPQKQQAIQHYFRQVKPNTVLNLIDEAREVDACIKGVGQGDIWQRLLCLSLKMQGVPV